MERTEVAERLTGIAEVLVANEQTDPQRTKAGLLREAREAMDIFSEINGKTAAAPRVKIETLPHLSKMQVMAELERLTKVRQEAKIIRLRLEKTASSDLKRLKELDADEKKGLKALSAAAKQIAQKERYIIESENAILEFTAYTDSKVPGAVQMIKREDEVKDGDIAGDFFGNVGKKLGTAMGKAVSEIYAQTKIDCTRSVDAIKKFKLLSKTASIKTSALKKAGLSDMIVSIRGWLSGEVDEITKRVFNFSGNIFKWVKGFAVRTGMVKKSTNALTKALDKAKAKIDSALA